MKTRDIKARAEELLEGYDEAMIEDLVFMITDEVDGMVVEDIDDDFILGLLSNWKGQLQDPGEWAFDAVQSEIETIEDQRYEEAKDQQMMGDKL